MRKSSIKMSSPKSDEKNDLYAGRLSKRLCYLLRYGALKENLTVWEGGYVDIKQLMKVHMMRHHSEVEVLQEIEESMSHRHTKRFEKKQENGTTLVRAVLMRKFEPNPCHEGSNVRTLLETCLDYVSTNISHYDLEEFPDEFLISGMIHRLKRKKKLNSNTLQQLLVPALGRLDLEGVFLTQGTLKVVFTNCPHLHALSLKDCSYIVTDQVVEQVVRKLPHLESLNLSACKHVTDRGIAAISRYGNNLRELNLSCIRAVSEKTLIKLLETCTALTFLDVYDVRLSPAAVVQVTEIARGSGLTLVSKMLTDNETALESMSKPSTNCDQT